MNCIAFKNNLNLNLNLNVDDTVYVKLNGNIFDESKVVEKSNAKNLIGVSLPEDAVKYIYNMQNNNYPIKYKLVKKGDK